MTKITPANIEQKQKSLKKLNKKLQNEIKSRQAEIKNVQGHYDIQLENRRSFNNDRLQEQKEIYANDLAKAIDDKNVKLQKIKANLEDNRKILENEKATIKQVHDENIQDIKHRQENHLQDTMIKGFDEQRELAGKVEREINKMNLAASNDIALHNLKMEDKIGRNAFTQDLKLRKSKQNFEVAANTQEQNFRRQKTETEVTHRNAMNDLLKEQQIEQLAREGIYKTQMSTMKKQHSQSMRQTDESYKLAMNQLIQNHQNAMDTMKSNFDKHMQQLKNELSSEKENYVTKAQDEFYTIEKLNPSYNRDNEFYYFSLEVPPHEKDFVKLQAHDRKVKISLSRTYENRIEDSVGKTHRSARSEVLAQEFEVPEILESNKVTTNYQDNVLTFRVRIK
jgi:hypothetical protein